MFAVAGVSGRTGAATADALLKQGQKVRVLVRDAAQGEVWARKHCEVAVVDLHNSADLAEAVKGLTGAYLLLPPIAGADDLLAAQATLLTQITAALKRSTLKSLLFLSSAGAQHPAGTGPTLALHRAEKALAGMLPSVTFLRPSFFVENWGAALLPAIDSGELPFFGHVHTKFAQVCAKDVGEAAAMTMISQKPGTHVVEISGKEPWSVEDVAVSFSSLLGQKIRAVEMPIDSAKATLEKSGMSPANAGIMAEMYQGMARGLFQFAHPHQALHGKTQLLDALKPFA